MFRVFEDFTSFKNVYTGIISPICEKYDLTLMELTILLFLHNNPQHDTAAEIIKLRRLTKSHVSISVRSLIEKGFLESWQKDHDRRTVHLKLLSAADSIIADGVEAQIYFGDVLFSGFSKEEINGLIRVVDRIRKNVMEYENKGGSYAG